jgi:hypothetical protein
MQKTALKVSGTVFLIIAVLQLLRFMLKIEVIAAGHVIPLWASLLAFIVMTLLALWMFRASK